MALAPFRSPRRLKPVMVGAPRLGRPLAWRLGLGGPGYWGAGLIGLGVGAAVGAALTAPAYAGPPPGPYAPVAVRYGPPAWSPEWYTYCAQRYRSFNPHTGYFTGYDGQP
jgi:hypothetical protein